MFATRSNTTWRPHITLRQNDSSWPFSPLLSCRGRTLKTSASLGSGHPVNSFYSIKKKTFCYSRC